MPLTEWVAFYILFALFWLWVLNWGGAKWLEGWKTFFIIDWFFAWAWSAEQLRFYALIILFCQTILFLVGLFKPEFRIHF